MEGLVPLFFLVCGLYILIPVVVLLSMGKPYRPRSTPHQQWPKLKAPPKAFIEGEFTVVSSKKIKEPAMSKEMYN